MATSADDAHSSAPRFCPWCGSQSPFRSQPRAPLWQKLADEKGADPPDAVEDALHTDTWVTGCPDCKWVSHVIGHHAGTT